MLVCAKRGAEIKAKNNTTKGIRPTLRIRDTSKSVPQNAIVPQFHGGHMPVDAELLKILACPSCKTPVTLVKDGEALKCSDCNRVYPVKDDIPIMLIDEATIEP